MKRVLVTIGVLAAAGAFFWRFPLVHVVSLQDVRAARQQDSFNAEQFVREFWSERLTPSLERAADAAAVLTVARQNPRQVRQQFGRSVGIGRAAFYMLRGRGTIVSIDEKDVAVSLDTETGPPEVLLHTGLLFGNVARDATGLIDSSDFSDSQEFNDVSTELNRFIETQIIATLKEQAQVGRRLRFVGCAEVLSESDWRPLQVVPLAVEFD
jgi:predicted lipoprotein